MSKRDYSSTELMICIAARLMEDGTGAFIGTGIPMLAAALAKRLYAPNLVPIFEFGGIGASLEDLPLGVGDIRTFHKALMAAGICDVMETATRDLIEYGFLGGAQIDPYGNLNSTVIGDHDRPKVRLPGKWRGQRCREPLLEDDRDHEARQAPVRGEGRLHHHAGVFRRPGGEGTGRAPRGDRALSSRLRPRLAGV
jgi:hypothetical protein